MRRFTLTFSDDELEAEYEDTFLDKHFSIWKSALVCLLLLGTGWFGYNFYINQIESDEYLKMLSLRQPNINAVDSCPPGLYW